ncbi:MAG: LD-carboxypeptidase [Deltaproteobacteria bacterium]|nr:LD-carboxypeptidase [Deltaproteobacteria bacterium]
MAFKVWQALKRGDIVDVVAPGFRSTDAEVQAGVQFLEGWGLRPRLPRDLFGEDVLSSNTDIKRLKHLEAAFSSKSSKAIWCLRGGYGSIRLIPGLMKIKKPLMVKPLLGISDVTTLQLFLEMKWKWPSLQAPLLDRLGRVIDPSVAQGRPMPIQSQIDELKQIVFGETFEVRHQGLTQLGKANQIKLLSKRTQSGLIEGPVTGGNLLTFASANGTSVHPTTEGKILYFEDVGERGYRVDRWLVQLVQTGIISKKTKAVIFGEFIEGDEKSGRSLVPDVLGRFSETAAFDMGVPVFTGIQCGHGVNQRVVPLGTFARLNLREGELVVATGAAHKPKGKMK